MLDDSDTCGEPSSVGIPPPPSPSAPSSEPLVHAPPLEPGPSYSNQNNEPPDLNSLHISSPPFSPTSSGNASPITPNHPEHDQKPAKRPNPLIDLIDTEKSYVDLLSGIIRKVAAAWSKNNLPPKELDAVFRAIEGIYKANRSLLNKLKEIGPKPSSPKALGDLLMRWVDDLEPPYSRYASVYLSGFDDWEPLTSNRKLPIVLSEFTISHPATTIEATLDTVWTLDALLALPRTRLKYYKRLYGRLLKSTNSGRSDFQLLLAANEKLDQMMNLVETRSAIRAGGEAFQSQQTPSPEIGDSQVKGEATPPQPPTLNEVLPQNITVSNTESSERINLRSSISDSLVLKPPPLPSLLEVESIIDTRKTLDIFSMRPKPVKLSLRPSGLPFTRELRSFYDVVIQFTSRADGVERSHDKGRVFLMTDLFLVCEQLPESETSSPRTSEPSTVAPRQLSLCYPPLAARHLTASAVGDEGIDVVVLKKEVLHLHLPSTASRDALLRDFECAIQTAHSLNPGMTKTKTIVTSSSGNTPNQTQAEKQPAASRPSTADTQNSIPSPSSTALYIPNYSATGSNGQAIPGRAFMSPPPSAPLFRGGPGYIAQPKPMPLPPDIPNMLDSRASTHMNGSLPPPGPAQTLGLPFGQPPHRQYSAPPDDFRPPPRGTSLVQNDSFTSSQHRHPHNTAPVPERPFDPGRPPPGYPGVPLAREQSRSSSHSMGEHSNQARLRKASSSRSLNSQYSQYPESSSMPIPPIPSREPSFMSQYSRSSNLNAPTLPSVALRGSQAFPARNFSIDQYSPPPSPPREAANIPTTSTVSASMKCKVFLKQQHAQWKSLGAARLKLFHQHPTHVKQLVVEADTKDHPVIISTIILTDGVERVGKTGVAIELSDKGQRTGIVYMIQLRNEASAGGLFDQLLLGSDRQTIRP